ncbi:hypothetical protein CBL_02848 [Carabus blaptoides fortunei]
MLCADAVCQKRFCYRNLLCQQGRRRCYTRKLMKNFSSRLPDFVSVGQRGWTNLNRRFEELGGRLCIAYRRDAFTSLDRRLDRGSTANLKLCQVKKFTRSKVDYRSLAVHTNLITKGFEKN